MASSTISPMFENDSEVWSSLKGAIAKSSGFKQWYAEKTEENLKEENIDSQVRLYLRETLETLAY